MSGPTSDWPNRVPAKVVMSSPLPIITASEKEDKRKHIGSILKRAYNSQIDIPHINEETEEEIEKHKKKSMVSSFAQTGYDLFAAFLPTLKTILRNQDDTMEKPLELDGKLSKMGDDDFEDYDHCHDLSLMDDKSLFVCTKCKNVQTCTSFCNPSASGISNADRIQSKFRIREEAVSDCSDTGSYEVKKITICLGTPKKDSLAQTSTSKYPNGKDISEQIEMDTTKSESFTPPSSTEPSVYSITSFKEEHESS